MLLLVLIDQGNNLFVKRIHMPELFDREPVKYGRQSRMSLFMLQSASGIFFSVVQFFLDHVAQFGN